MEKINRQSGIAPILIILIVLGLLGVGGGVVYMQNKNKAVTMESPTPTPMVSSMPTEAPKAKTMTVKLNSQNNSKQTGEAVLTEVDGKVKVVLSVSGAPSGVAQPAHIHLGACPTPGAVKYPLTSVDNGASQTMLDVTLEQLLTQLPLAVNVHKSSTEASVYVACGDITADDKMTGASSDKPEVKEFTMTSWYEMKDGKPSANFSLKEIRVKKGDTVRIKVTNTKGSHDFSLDEYGIKNMTPLDQQVTIEFKADKVGSFKYYCSMNGHRAMGQEGTFIVTE